MSPVMMPCMTVGCSPSLPALAPDFRLSPVRRLIPAARGGEVMIPCQPRAAPKAVVLWSKGTEILVNSSRYRLHPTPSHSCSPALSLEPSPFPGPCVSRGGPICSVPAAG